jgi:hypothetical protein
LRVPLACPLPLGTGGGQAFGEGDSTNFFGNGASENAVPISHISTGINYTSGKDGQALCLAIFVLFSTANSLT